MALDPAKLTANLIDDYSSYLSSRFFFKDAHLREQFSSLLANERRLFGGPFLELTPPFKPGDTPRALVKRGVLDETLLRLPDEALYPDRTLYLHQQRAIEKIQSGRNIIVATGTGSGKTETYLLPILNQLLCDECLKNSRPAGIRALLLYPMNALANDQIKRIRHLLRTCPGITFGRYIGETPTSRMHGLTRFRETWPQEPVISNELKSREEMWETPPDILVTNFAMLEYLLVRPQDSVFFNSGAGELLRFLVLDEIHTYDGARGTEIAMLLRRLKQRIGLSPRGSLRCVGTSATLGGGRDLGDVAEFADALFNEPFQYSKGGDTCDVIEAERIVYENPQEEWGPISPQFYSELARGANIDEERFKKLVEEEATIPGNIRKAAIEIVIVEAKERVKANDTSRPKETDDWFSDNPKTTDVNDTQSDSIVPAVLSRALYEILRGDTRVTYLKKVSADGPKPLSEIQQLIFAENGTTTELYDALLGLISLASKAAPESSQPSLIKARYHLLFRSLEGGFICLGDHDSHGPKLYLERRKTCVDHPDSKVFEIGVCRRCGEAMLVGSLSTEPLSRHYVLTSEDPTQEMLVEDEKRQRIFLTLAANVNQELNEDELVDEIQDGGNTTRFIQIRICRRCGALGEGDREWECECGEKALLHDVYKIPNRGRDVELCPSCGSRSLQRDILQTIYTGPDEPVAELATTIFQSSNESYLDGNGEKRKLLTFSDSRQDAAYFAPYLETLYRTTLRRHVILSLLQHEAEPLPVEDLAGRLARYLEEKQWLGQSATRDYVNAEAWRWVMGELLHTSKDRRSLEELGLVDFVLRRFAGMSVPQPLLRTPWCMTDEESWILVQILLDTLREAYVFTLPSGLARDDDIFAPARGDAAVALKRVTGDMRTRSWIPQLSYLSNTRLDYLRRLVQKRNLAINDDAVRKFLLDLFEKYLTEPGQPFITRYFDRYASDTRRGVVFQLAPRGWSVVPPTCLSKAYRCTRCGFGPSIIYLTFARPIDATLR